MSKLLNRLSKTASADARCASTAGPRTYETSIPRLALGFAGVAMAVLTIAVSVILPARMDTRSPEPRLLAASKATAPAAIGLATVTSIDVVSAREPGSSTVAVRIGEADPQAGWLGKTTSPAVIRVSSTHP